MIAIGPAIYSLLKGDAAVAALVATRITPNVLAQNTTTPAIVYQSWFRGAVEASDGPSGTETHRLQLDAYGTTEDVVERVIAACADALCPKAGRGVSAAGHARRFGAVEIQGAFQQPGGGPTYDFDVKLHRRSQDFLVWAASAA